jgi:hypothetical protein
MVPRMAWLALMLGWAAGAAAAERKQQLLPNGGFERGLKAWQARGLKLIADPRVAHRGVRCLMGEVFRRRQSRTLRRSLKLRRDRLYRFSIWARASQGSRLTVWLKAAGERRVIANWHGVARRWTRYRVNFTVPADGRATLEIAAPSSFWARVGRMWIDDLMLTAEPLLPQAKLSTEPGFDDMPCMAQTGPNDAWAAWLRASGEREALAVLRLHQPAADADLEVAERWSVELPAGAGVLDPVLAAGSQNSAWLVYAAEVGDNWDLYAVALGAAGPGRPLRLTRHAAVDIHPAAVVDGQTLWVAWESNRDGGRRHIHLLAVRDGQAGRPLRLSQGETNNYQPDVVRPEPGRLLVAWHSFRDGNFDLYTREVAAGALEPERRLTRAALIDRGVRLLARDGRVWLAWDQAGYAGYKVGRNSLKRVVLARLDHGRLRQPAGLRRTRLWQEAETPTLAFDAAGRLWVAALVPRDRNSGWDTLVWRLARKGWAGPWVLSRRKGMNRRPALATPAGRVAVLYQSDDMPGRWRSYEARHQGDSDVYLGRIDSGPRPRGEKLKLKAYDAPAAAFEPARLRRARGEDRPGWETEIDGRRLRLLFGDLHEHSDLSVCDRTRDETPDQSYQMMRDLIGFDFGALTDHGKNFNDYLWRHLGKRNRSNIDAGRFLTLKAQEWTSTFEKGNTDYPYGYYGHRVLVFGDARAPRFYNAADGDTPEQLRGKLHAGGVPFVLIPHQLADTGNVPVDWARHDEGDEPVAEIFQFRGSYECKGCPREAELSTPRGWFLQDAWARGTRVGVVAAPDHRGGHGKAALWAEDLSPSALLEALRARRTYGTTAARILLEVRVAGHFMGAAVEPLAAGQSVPVRVRVDCPRPIRQVVVLRDNQPVFRARPRGRRADFTWRDKPAAGAHWYYVRVVQRDGELAWSSPVWFGRPEKPPPP